MRDPIDHLLAPVLIFHPLSYRLFQIGSHLLKILAHLVEFIVFMVINLYIQIAFPNLPSSLAQFFQRHQDAF